MLHMAELASNMKPYCYCDKDKVSDELIYPACFPYSAYPQYVKWGTKLIEI